VAAAQRLSRAKRQHFGYLTGVSAVRHPVRTAFAGSLLRQRVSRIRDAYRADEGSPGLGADILVSTAGIVLMIALAQLIAWYERIDAGRKWLGVFENMAQG
jgi:hypothetical protein